MARHLLQRLLLALPALWLVLTLVFLMIHIVPGDPVEQMLGEGAAPGEIVQLRHSLGLDQPLLAQYGHYLKGLARLDLGQSFKFQAPVYNQHLRMLAGLKHLHDLDLSAATHISDAGLKHLAALKQLRQLNLRSLSLSNEAVQQLREELPNCEILR